MARKNPLAELIETYGRNEIPADEFEAALPDIPEKMIKEANSLFQHYLFFRRIDKHHKEYTCSACGEHFTISNLMERTVCHHEQYVFSSTEGCQRKCPRCHSLATLKAISRGRKKLTEIVCADFVLPINKNFVVIRGCYLKKDYHSSPVPEIEISDLGTTIIYPGGSKRYHIETRYHFGEWEYMYHLYKKEGNNFTANNLKNGFYCYNYRTHATIGLKSLKSTFLKYAPYEHFQGSVPACLSWYTKHPIIEKLYKAGYTGIVGALISHNIKHNRAVNWNADTIPQFFKGLNADEYKFFIGKSALELGDIIAFYKEIGKELTIGECSDILSSKEDYTEYRKNGVSKKKAFNYCKYINSGYNLERLKKVIPKKSKNKLYDYLDYIIANNNSQIMYIDYLEIAKELKYDLSVHNVLFPKNLKEAHDNAVKNRRIKAEKDLDYPKRYKELIKMYEYEKDGFSIIIPKGSEEIITEGKKMAHCVGGYAHRHMTGATTILFLRKTDDIENPLYTIEIDDKSKSVRQIQGYNNKTPLTEEAEAFFNEWKEEIKHRKIKKKKIKKSA